MRSLLTLLLLVPLIGFCQYWQQQGQDIDGEATGDQSGSSVSMNAAVLQLEHLEMMAMEIIQGM